MVMSKGRVWGEGWMGACETDGWPTGRLEMQLLRSPTAAVAGGSIWICGQALRPVSLPSQEHDGHAPAALSLDVILLYWNWSSNSSVLESGVEYACRNPTHSLPAFEDPWRMHKHPLRYTAESGRLYCTLILSDYRLDDRGSHPGRGL
jgi:hypothetical protein